VKVILFGATGMVGQCALRECLFDPEVESVLAIVRTPTGKQHPKLRGIAHKDFTDFSAIEDQLAGYDACLYCLGATSVGVAESDYTHFTYDLAMAAAQTLVKVNPDMTFVYVSAMGADSTERGKGMWARVKGKTENALLRLPFKAVYVVRPGYIQPLHGIQSRNRMYQRLYTVIGPLYPLWRTLFPTRVSTSEQVGRAMVSIAKQGASKHVLEVLDINAIANG
jgi:uncharacterized protein YbjT (DUF2867 family)